MKKRSIENDNIHGKYLSSYLSPLNLLSVRPSVCSSVRQNHLWARRAKARKNFLVLNNRKWSFWPPPPLYSVVVILWFCQNLCIKKCRIGKDGKEGRRHAEFIYSICFCWIVSLRWSLYSDITMMIEVHTVDSTEPESHSQVIGSNLIFFKL